jgi:hypothetical protein
VALDAVERQCSTAFVMKKPRRVLNKNKVFFMNYEDMGNACINKCYCSKLCVFVGLASCYTGEVKVREAHIVK